MTVFRARIIAPQSAESLIWLEDGLLVVDETGRIVEVTAYDGRAVDQDLRPNVILPGFVDAHVHYPQTRIVGSASGPLLDWLAKSTFPEETRFSDATHFEKIAAIFARSMAAAGTTSALIYGPVFPQASDALFAELDRTGMRGILGPVLMDANSPAALLLPVEQALEGLSGLVERWHGKDDRLEVAVIPRFALSCTANMMAKAADFAAARGLWVSTHLSENLIECQVAREMFGTEDYLKVYEDAGLLHARSVYAHCIHLSESEWTRFAASRAVVAHCPDSNAFLGSGHMPIGTVLDRGIPLAIGTDIAGGRSFRVPRILSSAYDNALATGRQVTPTELLWWGTRGGGIGPRSTPRRHFGPGPRSGLRQLRCTGMGRHC